MLEYWNIGGLRSPLGEMEGHALSWPFPVADATERVPPKDIIPLFPYSIISS
jgi:hypothetical protein